MNSANLTNAVICISSGGGGCGKKSTLRHFENPSHQP
jgi:hypothetical protein